MSARWKFGRDVTWLQAALDHHRAALLAGLPLDRARPDLHDALRVAAELAALMRWMDYSNGRFGLTVEQLERLQRLEEDAAAMHAVVGSGLRRNADLIRARHAMTLGDRASADRLLRTIIGEDPRHAYARVLLGWNLHATGRLHEALELAVQAATLEPLSAEALELSTALSGRFEPVTVA